MASFRRARCLPQLLLIFAWACGLAVIVRQECATASLSAAFVAPVRASPRAESTSPRAESTVIRRGAQEEKSRETTNPFGQSLPFGGNIFLGIIAFWTIVIGGFVAISNFQNVKIDL
mmetsp:Transcript_92720/g.198751  ORF Transcript_92720/g.198751 Transcript_92720/m.198751 type:complete len:117 (-) Transcript_92720:214-564(-)